MHAVSCTPELGEKASNTIIVSHSAGSIWDVFWAEGDRNAAEAELKRLKIKPKKQFDSNSEDYRNPWEGRVKNFTVARLTTKQVDKLIESSKMTEMQLSLD